MQAVSCPRCGAPVQQEAAACPYCRTGLAPDSKSPDEWVQYRDDWSGFELLHPRGWSVETRKGSISVREDPAGITAAYYFPSGIKSSGKLGEDARRLAAGIQAGDPSFQAWIPGNVPPDADQIPLKTRDLFLGREREGFLNLRRNGENLILSGYEVPSPAAAQQGPRMAKILSTIRPVERLPRRRYQEPAEGAFALLVPQDWEVKGMIDRSSGGGLPAFNVTRPPLGLTSAGKPSSLWHFQEPQPGMYAGYPSASHLPFMSSAQFCQQILAPWFSQSQAGFTIETIVERPDLAEGIILELVRAGYPRGSHETSVAIMETGYTEAGTKLRQKTRVNCTRMSNRLTFGISGWTASIEGYYRAPEGEFPALEPTLCGILDSFAVDPAWEAAQVQRNLGMTRASQNDIHRRLGQISQTISETNDMIYEGYQHRQAVDDRMAEKRSDATLGVHSVESPTGEVYKVPDGYDRYWTNGLGDLYGGTLLSQPDAAWIPLVDKGDQASGS